MGYMPTVKGLDAVRLFLIKKKIKVRLFHKNVSAKINGVQFSLGNMVKDDPNTAVSDVALFSDDLKERLAFFLNPGMPNTCRMDYTMGTEIKTFFQKNPHQVFAVKYMAKYGCAPGWWPRLMNRLRRNYEI